MRFLALAMFLVGCSPLASQPVPTPTMSPLVIANLTGKETRVYIALGINTVVKPKDWNFCMVSSEYGCEFTLPPHGSKPIATNGKYLNATISFDAPVGCGTTKAELNINNPEWYDVLDVSLVDGFSNKIQITAEGNVLGPPAGADGNEALFGIYPLGCDLCVARQAPPCGQIPGTTGCKAGSQYHPEVPCQWQGSKMGGGSVIRVALVP